MGNTESQAAGSAAEEQGFTNENSACPVPERYRTAAVYNVYNQRIDSSASDSTGASKSPINGILRVSLDPANMMPTDANQQPCPGQRRPLSLEREKSTIPKGGTDTEWLYPSPQMFFNALKRKGKGDDVQEEDMEAVVHTHNSMNEITWQKVMAWESLHWTECGYPKLLRFRGRPDDLSPLARIRSLFDGRLPFDRHDWYIDRCGKEVRYVIDFYFDDEKAGSEEAFEIVARPAIDTPAAVIDRMKMQIYTIFARYGLPCPVTGHRSQQHAGARPQDHSSDASGEMTTS